MRYRIYVLPMVLLLLIIASIPSTLASVYSVSVKLYNDGSVSFHIEGTYALDKPTKVEGDLYISSKVKDKGATIDLDGVLKPLEKAKEEISMLLKAASNGNGDGEKAVSDTNIDFSMTSEKDEINVSATVHYTAYKDERRVDIDANVSIIGEGTTMNQLKTSLMQIKKDTLESMLRMQGIDWVDIKRFDKTFDDVIKLGIGLSIDIEGYSEYVVEQAKKSGVETNITKEDIIESFEEGFYEYSYTMELEMEFTTDRIVINMSLDSTFEWSDALKALERAINATQLYGYPQSVPSIPVAPPVTPTTTPIPSSEVEEVASIIGNITEEYEVLPSDSTMHLSIDNDTVSYAYDTPKIRAKGAENPADTLSSIIATVESLKDTVKDEKVRSELESLYNSNVTLVPEEGVKVSQTTAKFSEANETGIEVSAAEGPGYEEIAMIVIILVVVLAVVLTIRMLLKK